MSIDTEVGVPAHDAPTWDVLLDHKLGRITVNLEDFDVVIDDATLNQGDKVQNAFDFCVGLGCDLNLGTVSGSVCMRTAGGALKKAVLDMSLASGPIRIHNPAGVTLKWKDDIGTGAYGVDVQNATSTNYPIFDGLIGEGKYPGRCDPNANATPASAGSFLRLPNRTNYRNLTARGFYAGFISDGEDPGTGSTENTDHVVIENVDSQECVWGIFVTGDSRKSRDFRFIRCLLSRNQRAGIGIDQNAELTDLTTEDCHFNANPFGVWGLGATRSNTGLIGNWHAIRTKFEGEGNGFIWVDATDGSGDIQRITGFLEFHGIETNGQPTGGGGGISDSNGDTNHTWRPWAATTIARNGSGTVTATFPALPAPLQVGDAIVAYVSDNHTLNSSVGGGFTVISITGAGPYVVTWEQAGGSVSGIAGSCGPCVAVRCGALVEADVVISMLTDPTTINAHPELNFDCTSADNVTLTTFGQLAPKFRFSGAGLNGRKTNVLWRRGTSEAFLAKAAGTFAAGKQLESAANGGVKLSTLTLAIPNAGTALQPGATAIAVATGQVVSLIYTFVMKGGRNSAFAFGGANGFGIGATYTTDPGNPAVLCEDPAHHGDVIACPFTTGTWRVVGYSLQAGSGGLIDMMQRDPYVVVIP